MHHHSTHHKTPSVTVLDSRGLTVRSIAYHRHPDAPDVTRERITCHQYDARGVLTHSADPRLQAAGLANFSYLTDLTGSVLRTQGVDNGITISLNDAAGRPFLAFSNIATGRRDDRAPQDRRRMLTRTWQYEDSELPGRLLSVTEQATGDAARITERFVYAGHSEAEKARNLAGQCVSHYDTAGLTQTGSVALTGVPRSVIRRLLKDADNPDTVADWQGEEAAAWHGLLTAQNEGYTTLTTADATGAVLATTDPKGNRQRVAYDVAGLLSGSWLTLKGKKEQTLIAALTYSAAGQKLREEHGNGVVTTYTYEAQTQRLTGMKTARPAGHASGVKVLQDLHYTYDPAGNVLSVRNDAQETCFWRNQKVVAENTYGYDSLYQLVSATGRERAGAGQQGSSLPAVTASLAADSSAYTNYTRTYTYDEAGNLTQIRHSAPATGNNYTTNITVSDRSNRGVLSALTENAAEVDALFTAGGQQRQLQPGQALSWTARGELLTVTPVTRDGATDDRESYRYGADSQRVLKVSVQQTKNRRQTQRVLYLPGLELRTTDAGSTQTQSLQVITAGEAGRAQVRVLHWTGGKPADIGNDQMRYSYDNLTGSSQLELDGEGNVISMEEYYPYGGTAVWTARNRLEADYKTIRYSGKERDATGLYYYGWRYYQPWAGRWLSADPAGTADGLNLFRMCRNNPVTFKDSNGLIPTRNKLFNSLRKPKIETGDERNQPDASFLASPLTKSADFTGIPVLLQEVLTEDALSTTPLLTDLINPAKVAMSEDTKNVLANKSGGILAFNAIRFSAGENKDIHALRIVDRETSTYQYGGAVSLAYWAPQGGYVDIPAHPQLHKNEPNIVLTPAFSGCSLVVDKINENTLRVRHVQGGKEDLEYNDLPAAEHGMGMVDAMEYRHYGFHKNVKGGFIENITGSAFMIYENNQWKIKFQRLAHPPGISSLEEGKHVGLLGGYTRLTGHIRYNSGEKSVVSMKTRSLRH